MHLIKTVVFLCLKLDIENFIRKYALWSTEEVMVLWCHDEVKNELSVDCDTISMVLIH